MSLPTTSIAILLSLFAIAGAGAALAHDQSSAAAPQWEYAVLSVTQGGGVFTVDFTSRLGENKHVTMKTEDFEQAAQANTVPAWSPMVRASREALESFSGETWRKMFGKVPFVAFLAWPGRQGWEVVGRPEILEYGGGRVTTTRSYLKRKIQ